MNKQLIRNSTAEFLIFTSQAGEDSIEVRVENESIWLTQKLMAELFDVTVPTINEHLKNIFSQGELEQEATIRNFRITASDGKNYKTKHYNLDAWHPEIVKHVGNIYKSGELASDSKRQKINLQVIV